jgi:uncharacterized protein YggU (UPF0235/DUF167 family)
MDARPASKSVRLTMHVQTRKNETKLFSEPDGTLIMHVAAPPVKDKANREIRKWLARKLRTSSANVQLIAGLHSNVKVIEITGMTDTEVSAALGIG